MHTSQRLLPVMACLLTAIGGVHGLTPVAGAEENPGIETRVVEYRDGEEVFEGFLATPRGLTAPTPGVLVVHEWWGLNDYARERAVQLAGEGYVAFAADIYGKGKRATSPQEAGALASAIKSNRPLMRQRTELALQALRDSPHVDPARLAAIGYCFGGTCVLELARGGANLAGVVSFHGSLDAVEKAAPGSIKARVLVCHGAADPHVPAADVTALLEELTAAGADWQFIHYSGAVHAFTNPRAGNDPSKGAAYHAPSDRRSWAHMQGFFAELFNE